MGLRLKAIRKDQGLTQAQAAEKHDTTSASISRHERGIGVNLEQLEEYARVYGCHVTDCFTGPHLLTHSEKRILRGLRRLNPKQREAVLMNIAAMRGDGEDGDGADEESELLSSAETTPPGTTEHF